MTDNELNLALARMMKLPKAYLSRGAKYGKLTYIPTVYYASEDDWRDFDAIHSGADFDRVLMYARRNKRAWAAVQLCVLEDDPEMPPEMFRRTVCEAIVGAGE